MCEALVPRSDTASPLHTLKNAVGTKQLSLFSLDHELKISSQSQSQHILKNFPIVLVIFLAPFFAGEEKLGKKKRAPEERSSAACLNPRKEKQSS